MPESNSNILNNRNKRILNDLKELQQDNIENIYVSLLDGSVIDNWNILIIGNTGPYKHGFFFFEMTFPQNYPFSSPKVHFKTTQKGKTRFNPNLYSDGKVCLSILGTWSGPPWKSIMTAKSVLLSIQSILCENPLYNEPGFDNRPKTDSIRYNLIIEHETFRFALYEMLKNPIYPEFKEIMKEYYEKNKEIIIDKLKVLNNNKDDILIKYGKKLNNNYVMFVSYTPETGCLYLHSRVI